MSGSSDARALVSVLAVERALAFYLDEARIAKSPPIPAAEVQALSAALSGSRAWEPRLFDTLVTLGKVMHRLAETGKVPLCTVGDGITALASRVRNAGDGRRWSFDPAVDPAVFAKLELRETSLGIGQAQRDHREGWWAHADKNRRFIADAAAATTGKRLAVVLGAGQAFDLPLADLARTFERLVLVDIDGEALEATIASALKDPALRARAEPRVMDMTGINKAFVQAVDEIIDRAADTTEVEAAVEGLCHGYRLPGGARLVAAGERAELLVSSCVLSQVGWPQRIYATRRYEQRFGRMRAAYDARWSMHFSELEMRVQQDHVNALAGAADTVVLTSDVVGRPTVLDPSGNERETGREIYTLGVPSLLERVPQFLQVGAKAAWLWSRYRASRRGTEGSRTDVEALLLREPTSAGGLWIP